MPLAPPVTMAVRPASLAMGSSLFVQAPHELVDADHQHIELLGHAYFFGASFAMNAANAASCCLIKPRVVSSLSSPVFSSNLDATLPMKTSGLLSVNASRKTMLRRMSYWTRPPPRGPGDADNSATGLPANGWLGSRETQSIAFLRPPGMPKLYSGVQKITPSAPRMASASVFTGAGKPVEFLKFAVVWGRITKDRGG